jgi:hypothetical protein
VRTENYKYFCSSYLKREKRRLKHRLKAGATKRDMELYHTPGAGDDPFCFPECGK